MALKAVLCEMVQEEEKSNMGMEAGKVIRGMDNTVVKTVCQTVPTAHRVWTPMLHKEVQVKVISV